MVWKEYMLALALIPRTPMKDQKTPTVNHPLGIIAIFASLSEIAMTVTIFQIDAELQKVFIWFVMGFPILLVCIFFLVLYRKPAVLFSPADYEKDASYLDSISDRKEIIRLNTELDGVKETTRTLKTYLETVLEKIAPHEQREIVSKETERLRFKIFLSEISRSDFMTLVIDELHFESEFIIGLVSETQTLEQFVKLLQSKSANNESVERFVRSAAAFPRIRSDFEKLKTDLAQYQQTKE